MTAVHQFLSALLPRDATGAHALALRSAFRAAGWSSEIYVEAAHDELLHEATYFGRYPGRATPGDVLLYHLSTASPIAELLAGRAETLVLDYHNVTPASFYVDWEPETARRADRARLEAAALASRAALGITHSRFNADELSALGCPSTEVIPVLSGMGPEHWRAPRSEAVGSARAAGDPGGDHPGGDHPGGDQRSGAAWLFVGRLSPNKAQHRVVEALWWYRRLFDPGARLDLVGSPVTPAYVAALSAFVAELGLEGAVRLHEGLSTDQLRRRYMEADVFVCLSEHEGFCVPLMEAMAFGLPIVAYRAGAVPETLGDAGLLVDAKRPATVAVAVSRVLGDETLRAHLRRAGQDRLDRLDPDAARSRFVEVLAPLVGAPLPASDPGPVPAFAGQDAGGPTR